MRKANIKLKTSLDKELAALGDRYKSLKDGLQKVELKVRKERALAEGNRECLKFIAQQKIDECDQLNSGFERQIAKKREEVSALESEIEELKNKPASEGAMEDDLKQRLEHVHFGYDFRL